MVKCRFYLSWLDCGEAMIFSRVRWSHFFDWNDSKPVNTLFHYWNWQQFLETAHPPLKTVNQWSCQWFPTPPLGALFISLLGDILCVKKWEESSDCSCYKILRKFVLLYNGRGIYARAERQQEEHQIVRKNIRSVLNKFKVQNDTKNVEKSGLMTMSHNVCNKVDELIMQID